MVHAHTHPTESGCKICAEEPPADLLAACRAAGLRRTHLLRRVLDVLQRRAAPVSIRQLATTRAIRDICDPATLYRLLQRLEAKGLVRRIGLHERAAHFTLRRGHHHDYVVCRECGDVALLEMECPAEKLEREVGRRTGFKEVDHELQFYGVCPKCSAH